MVTVTGEYKGELNCQVVHGPSNACVNTDAPVDNHGRGTSFSPTDLCATALMSCMATIMAIKAESMGIDLKGMRMKVDKHMSAKAPRRIQRLSLEYWIPVKLEERQQQTLERAALACPVHHSLHPDVEKPVVFHWE